MLNIININTYEQQNEFVKLCPSHQSSTTPDETRHVFVKNRSPIVATMSNMTKSPSPTF